MFDPTVNIPLIDVIDKLNANLNNEYILKFVNPLKLLYIESN